jgi:hypothetical protein
MKIKVFVGLLMIWSWTGGITAVRAQGSSLSSSEPNSKVYEVSSLEMELRRLQAVLQEGQRTPSKVTQVRDALPTFWTVHTPERDYSIPTAPLRDHLGSATTEKAQIWIAHLLAEVESSERGAPTTLPAAHADLKKILARKEFADVKPPGYLEMVRERAIRWLARMFLKLFSGMARHPIGAKALFWILVIAGVGFVALWIFRYLSARDSMQFLRPQSPNETTRTWEEWIRDARQAAARDDFREAVHSAYWAGIARLQDIGGLPRDRAKTPREYLRLVSSQTAEASGPFINYQAPLGALTSRLERIWYANRMARAEDFHDTLRQLEALGCSLE